MANKLTETKPIEALILVDCSWGKCGQVITVTQADIEASPGELDAEPAAVANAKQPQE